MHARRILVLGFCLLPVGSLAGDWPQFRGPNSTGLADDAKAPSEWGPDKNVLWKVQIPGVAWSCPIVTGDKVLVTTAITENQRKPQAGGGFGGGPPAGAGGRPGGFSPPPPGQLLPPFVQERLNLSAEQKKQLEELQKKVDAVLAKTLTDGQMKQLKDRPQGFGGRGGPGGFTPAPAGQVLSASLQESLKLSADQKKDLDALQKEVDGVMAKLLSEEQRKQLTARPGFGRGGFGPGGSGPGGFGGGGKPPDVLYRWEVHCLDRRTGKLLWKQLALEAKPRIPTHGSNTYASETPVTDGERVYAYFGMHGLFCYDLAGKLVWKKDLGAFPTQMGWGTASSPVLDGERLFLQIDNEEKSFLVALDKVTGDEQWRVSRSERTNWSTPIIWKNKQRTELVTSGSQKLRSYDPATGKVLWELSMGGGQSSSSPVGDAEMLYVGLSGMGGGGGGFGGGPGGGRPGGPGGGFGGAGGLFAIRAGASGDLSLKEGQTDSAAVAWSHSRTGPEMASPLVYRGHVYIFGRNGGIVTCYDARTGKQVYRERISGARAFWASPWASDGKIFCLDDGGSTHVLQAGPEFKVLGKNSLDEMFWATPAVAGRALFLRSVDHLYCIASADGPEPGR